MNDQDLSPSGKGRQVLLSNDADVYAEGASKYGFCERLQRGGLRGHWVQLRYRRAYEAGSMPEFNLIVDFCEAQIKSDRFERYRGIEAGNLAIQPLIIRLTQKAFHVSFILG